MAQTGYTPILLYSSSTGGNAPAAGNLTNSTLGSELAINIVDGKLFYKDSSNNVQVIAWKVTPTSAGGTGLTTYSQGDLLYYNSGTTLTALAKNTSATRYLSNIGTNNNPEWAQIDLTNGVTGDLPYSNLAQGSALSVLGVAGNATADVASIAAASDHQVLRRSGTSVGFGAIALNQTNAVTGTLAVGNGGTGLSTLTAGYIPFGNGTSAFGSTSNLFWNSSTNCLGIGLVNGTAKLTVAGTGANNAGAAATYIGTIQINEAGSFDLQTTGGLEFKGSVFGAGYGSKLFSTDAGNLLFGVRANSATWTEVMRLHNSAGVSIGNTTDPGAANLSVSGNVVIATSGKGIDFSATAGTGTSELLADYEEGTWTPVDGSGAGLTFSTAVGYYTKIGRMVTVVFNVVYPSTANGNAARVGGLPFTAANTANNLSNGSFSINTSAQIAEPSILANATNFAALVTAAGTSATNANLSLATLSGGLTYFV